MGLSALALWSLDPKPLGARSLPGTHSIAAILWHYDREPHEQSRGDLMRVPPFSKAVSILVCSVGIAAAFAGDAVSQGAPSRPLVSQTQYDAWLKELSNWGRWGKEDELGTLNLITTAK